MDTLLGLVGLGLYIVAIVGLAAAVTFLVVKLSPAQSAKKKAAEDT
jgi:hypothetical protein